MLENARSSRPSASRGSDISVSAERRPRLASPAPALSLDEVNSAWRSPFRRSGIGRAPARTKRDDRSPLAPARQPTPMAMPAHGFTTAIARPASPAASRESARPGRHVPPRSARVRRRNASQPAAERRLRLERHRVDDKPPPGASARKRARSVRRALAPPPMKIASGAAGRPALAALRRRRWRGRGRRAQRRCGRCGRRVRGALDRDGAIGADRRSIHSIATDPDPAPTSHSNSPRRGASAERVIARISRLVICPSCSNKSSGSPAARGMIARARLRDDFKRDRIQRGDIVEREIAAPQPRGCAPFAPPIASQT